MQLPREPGLRAVPVRPGHGRRRVRVRPEQVWGQLGPGAGRPVQGVSHVFRKFNLFISLKIEKK